MKREIVESSQKLNAKQRIGILQTAAAIKLDGATMKGDVEFTPEFWAVVHVTPDDAEEFDQYIIGDIDGNIYSTGSLSFWQSFKLIWDEMLNDDEGLSYMVKVFRAPSKKYEGKSFITCTII